MGIPAATVPSVFGPAITAGGALNAAGFAKSSQGLGTAVAPGSLVQIYGSFPGALTAAAGAASYRRAARRIRIRSVWTSGTWIRCVPGHVITGHRGDCYPEIEKSIRRVGQLVSLAVKGGL
jgi:hypothetical protein